MLLLFLSIFPSKFAKSTNATVLSGYCDNFFSVLILKNYWLLFVLSVATLKSAIYKISDIVLRSHCIITESSRNNELVSLCTNSYHIWIFITFVDIIIMSISIKQNLSPLICSNSAICRNFGYYQNCNSQMKSRRNLWMCKFYWLFLCLSN